MWNYEYLYNQNFLAELDQQQNLTQYIKLTVLTMQNVPIGTIEGKATGGSVSVNGSSAIRRSGSLSMIADESNYRITELSNIIYMNKKVSVEVGFNNNLNQYSEYDIIWFPLGVFVMSNANIQKNNSGINISLTLKDQMSLLNGENGGTFETAVTHSPMAVEKIDEFSGIVISEEPVLFYRLIYELITKWGHIPPEYIIIEDVPLTIENIVRWTGAEKINIITNDNMVSITESTGGEEEEYSTGDSIGYQEVDYVYPTVSDLTSSAGESITSVLDKIKQALGNYEYFFDAQGFFHFQKIKDYLTEGVGFKDLTYALTLNYEAEGNKAVYDFRTAKLINSYSNAPQWQNVKNDFVVWGKRGEKEAIRYHLIVDNKPTNRTLGTVWGYYDAFNIKRYASSQNEQQTKASYALKYAQQHDFNELPNPADSEALDLSNIEFTDWRLAAYFKSILNPDEYFYSLELMEEIPKLYDLSTFDNGSCFFQAGITPNTATWWIDIVDSPNIDKFKVSNIGKRTKSIQNDKINCLFDPFFPDIRFIEAGTPKTAELRKKYKELNKPFYQMQKDSYAKLALGIATNSAYEHLRSQIHTILSFNESVSIGIIPIYHLEPNTRIKIEDEDTNIHGDYMIKSFTLPLAAGGQMTLQCTKAIEMI